MKVNIYVPPVPKTIAQARALAYKMVEAHHDYELWNVPVDRWLKKANKPTSRYRVSGLRQLYDSLNDLASDLDFKLKDVRNSLRTGGELYPGHIVQEVLAIDNLIVKVMPPLKSDAIKI